MVSAAEAAIDDQQLALGADGCSPLVVLTGVWPLMMWPVGEHAMGATPNSRMMSSQTEGDLVSVKYGSSARPGALVGDIGALKGTHQASAGG